MPDLRHAVPQVRAERHRRRAPNIATLMPDRPLALMSLALAALAAGGGGGCCGTAQHFDLAPEAVETSADVRPTTRPVPTLGVATAPTTAPATAPSAETNGDSMSEFLEGLPIRKAPKAPEESGRNDMIVYPDAGDSWQYFTGARTFGPLIADPRWPGFLTTYRFQSGGQYLNDYEAVNLGDTIAIARGPSKFFGTVFETEFGVMGGTFSVFDPGHMQDLFALDYVGSAYGAVRRGRFSALARYWHLSSHVGDEFLLSDNYGGATRGDLLLENLQALFSYDLDGGFRVYGGGTYRLDVAPDEYGSFQLQAGVEWESLHKYGAARPFAAADGQGLSGYDYDPSVSVRGGLSFDEGLRGPSFRVTGEFFTGRDPNGQFFTDHVLYTGLGFTFRF